MAVHFSPEEQSQELMEILQSSNLHYAAQVTPFSIYITVRKKFRKASNFVTSNLIPKQPSHVNILNENLESLQRDHEDKLKQKEFEYSKLKVANDLLEEKLVKEEVTKLELETELEEKSLECHEIKVTNNILQERIEKVELESIADHEDKERLNEKVEFLLASVKRSTEETLSMERKLNDAKKANKKIRKESVILNEKVEFLEHSNKILEEEYEKVQNDKKLSDTHNNSYSVSTKNTMTHLSSFSSSPKSSTFDLTPNLQAAEPVIPQDSSIIYSADPRKPFPPFREPQDSSTIYPDHRKPFPPYSEPKDFSAFNPIHQIGNVVTGKLFPPCENDNTGKPLAQDGNNNSAVETKNVDLFNEAKFVDDQKTSTDAIKKSMFYFGGC